MNIRSVSNPAQVLAKENIEESKTIRSNETADREANGQQSQGETNDGYRPLTAEELDQVIEKIKANEGIQRHGLLVQVSHENDTKVLKIESPDGQLVKRFVERDLYNFLFSRSSDDIQLVKKTA